MGLLDKVERMEREREAASISPEHAAVLIETREIVQRTVSTLTERALDQAGFVAVKQKTRPKAPLPDDDDATQPLPAIVGRFWHADGCVLTDQGKRLPWSTEPGGRLEVDPYRDLRPLRGIELLDSRDAEWNQDGDSGRWIAREPERDPWMVNSARIHAITPEGSAGVVTWEYTGGGYHTVIVPLEQWADDFVAGITTQ